MLIHYQINPVEISSGLFLRVIAMVSFLFVAFSGNAWAQPEVATTETVKPSGPVEPVKPAQPVESALPVQSAHPVQTVQHAKPVKTSKKATYRLPEGLMNSNWRVREQTIKKAIRDVDTKTMGKLAAMSRKDPHEKVRQAAAWAVGEMDLKMRKSVLWAIIQSDESAAVRSEAEMALKKLEGRYSKDIDKPADKPPVAAVVSTTPIEGCQKDTDCKGERICLAPPHPTAGWSRGAGIYGFVGAIAEGGLSLSAALNKEHLVPAIPLAAGGTVVTVISAAIISAGSNSARTMPEITGSLGFRLLGWLSFGFHITGSLALATAVPFHWLKEDEDGNKWTPPTAWIVANGGLGMLSLICLSLDSIIAGNQAKAITSQYRQRQKTEMTFNWIPSVSPVFGPDGSTGAVVGASGTF